MQQVAPRGAFKWLLQVLSLATVYYVAGRLALLMAIPPGYATAAWPAAGIGVVALIVWGFRVWPAVALGSFLINATLSLAAPLGSGQQVLVAAGISLGATLQALAGAALVRRWVDPSILFAREKAIVKLLVLAGPIACLISASVAVGTLYLAQVVPISDIPFHWWTWWIGDTIGVLLVGPVYLTWSASAQQLSSVRKIQLSIALSVLAALVVLTFVHTSALEQQRIEADFSRRTEHLTRVLTLKVAGYTDVLEAIGDLYASDAQVSRGQFATFVSRSLLGRPGIQALSWNPLVGASERAEFEANARAEGYRNFQITELAADGHLQPASPRPLYVPIQHIEPYVDNQYASGFDVASDVDRYAALMAARDSGRITATGSITLVQSAGHYGFLLALPVYHAAGQPQQHLRGYAVAAFRMQDVMATFLRGQDTTGMRIRLVDEQADAPRRVLYEKRSPASGQASKAVDVHDIRVKTASIDPAEGFARRSTITMGGRALTLQLDATPDYLLTQRSWLAWAVLVIGLLFTAMLGAFMLVVAGRAGLIEEVVVQRTAQLRNSNQELEIARRGLAENERGLEEAQKIARVGSWQWDVVADKVSWSDELYRIFGADRHALTPNFQSYLEHAHPEDRQRVDSAVRRALAAHQPFTFEHRIIRPDGAVRVMQANGRVAADDDGNVLRMLGTVQDVTEIKDAEQRLLQLAHFDTLTALPNRALFYKSLHDSLAQAGKQGWIVSVLFLDIDHFKNVNDTLGHACGDELLRQVASRLADTLRVRDTVARFGGDEFAIMLVNLDDRHDAATLVADKLRQVLRTPFILEGQEVTVTASIGATVFPADSTDADELLKFADTAMYAAKEAGRDTYRFYTAAMNAKVVRRLALDTALRRALERNEFVLHYQPKIELASGRWTGVEALLRWNRPDHGLVPPGDFIPLLEETGLIEPVGAWVINEACRQIASWRASGLAPVPIAVNVSVKQLLQEASDTDEQSALEQTVERALRDNDVPPQLLEIELTESTLMSNVARTVDLLHRLTALGIQIAIDDFGTGYSSLAYLKRFSVTIIKIDQSFVRDISSNADDAAITAAIINMSHSLKLRVIAEGVETPEQLAFLEQHGCDGAQGYLLARPMPAEACAELLRTPGFRQNVAQSS